MDYLEESLFFLPNDEFVILQVAQSQKVFHVGLNVQKNVPNTIYFLILFSRQLQTAFGQSYEKHQIRTQLDNQHH